MTQEELNYIKDSFSQILDDIGGNPDWYDAAKAVASDLGTMEKQLEERVTKLPSNMDEAAIDFADNARKQLYSKDYAIASIADYDHGCIDGFKAGAEWMAGQGISCECEITKDFGISFLKEPFEKSAREMEGNVVVQIRKR